MLNLFNFDNPFLNFMSKVADLIILNLLWIFCSIPIVTIGAATSALYSETFKLAEDKEGYIISSYFKAFKENFKYSTLAWILIVFIGYILFIDLSYWISSTSSLSHIIVILNFTILIIFFNASFCFFALQSKFKNTLKNTLKNSVLLTLKHFISSIPILFLAIGVITMNLKFPFAIFLTLLIGVSGFCQVTSYIYLDWFKRYEIL